MTRSDGDPTINEAKLSPPIPNYWCKFTDQTQSYIESCCLHAVNAPLGAVLLPETDPRLQHFLNPPEGRYVQRLIVDSMEDLHRFADRFDTGLPKPLYRGQGDYSWPLKTRLERNVPTSVFADSGLETYEYRILTDSQRRLHHFLTQLPDEDDLISWLALLRHHGVPTRLLDVTRSLFIACYFALRDAKPGTDAAVWIFSRLNMDLGFSEWNHGANDTWLRQTPFTVAQYGEPYYWPFPKKNQSLTQEVTIDTLRKPDSPWWDFAATLDAAMRGYVEKPGVAIAEPFWMSRRMDVQHGLFLVPFNVRRTFEENLFPFLKLSQEEQEERPVPIDQKELGSLWRNYKVIKLRIPASFQPFLRIKLDTMNIRDLTLFPDLEGALSQITALLPIDGR